jgi:hypothetical protein
VPALVVTGTQDLDTPTESARRIAALFPHGQTLVVPGIGHDVLGTKIASHLLGAFIGDACAARAVRGFFMGGAVAKRCSTVTRTATPVDPRSIREVRLARGTTGLPGRTLTAVVRTYQDALHSFFDVFREPLIADPVGLGAPVRLQSGGLRAGSFDFTLDKVVLSGDAYVRGVRVTGVLSNPAYAPRGLLRVDGSAAAAGTLRVRRGVVSGRLGGRRVTGHLGPDLFDLVIREIPKLESLTEQRSAAVRATQEILSASVTTCWPYLKARRELKHNIRADTNQLSSAHGPTRRRSLGRKKADDERTLSKLVVWAHKRNCDIRS